MFWTLLIARESSVLETKRAEMCLRDQFVPDMETFENAVARGPMIPSTIDVDCVWDETGPREVLRDEENQFVYKFRPAVSQVSWRASEPGVSYRSVETNIAQETLFAALGDERNGEFFR